MDELVVLGVCTPLLRSSAFMQLTHLSQGYIPLRLHCVGGACGSIGVWDFITSVLIAVLTVGKLAL
jgi:hypothetical protein